MARRRDAYVRKRKVGPRAISPALFKLIVADRLDDTRIPVNALQGVRPLFRWRASVYPRYRTVWLTTRLRGAGLLHGASCWINRSERTNIIGKLQCRTTPPPQIAR